MRRNKKGRQARPGIWARLAWKAQTGLAAALAAVEARIEALRLQRQGETLDRWEAVESLHEAARPALPERLVRIILAGSRRGEWMPVDIYNLEAARRDLQRLAARDPARACRYRVVLHHVAKRIEARRRTPPPGELELYLLRLPRGLARRVAEGEWLRIATSFARPPRRQGPLPTWSGVARFQVAAVPPPLKPRRWRARVRVPKGPAGGRRLMFALSRLAALRRFYPRRKRGVVAAAGGYTPGRPPSAGFLRAQVWAAGKILGVGEALKNGHTDVDELDVAAIAAARELARFDPGRAGEQVDPLAWARQAAVRAAARARIKRVSGLSVPGRQMPLVGKLREQLAQGIEGPEELASATGLDLETVEALLPAAAATTPLEEGLVASEGSVEESYETGLLRERVRDALDALVGLERLAVEAFLAYDAELARHWPEVLKGTDPAGVGKKAREGGERVQVALERALEELRGIYRELRRGFVRRYGRKPTPPEREGLAEDAARRHAGKYWRAAAEVLRLELADFTLEEEEGE